MGIAGRRTTPGAAQVQRRGKQCGRGGLCRGKTFVDHKGNVGQQGAGPTEKSSTVHERRSVNGRSRPVPAAQATSVSPVEPKAGTDAWASPAATACPVEAA